MRPLTTYTLTVCTLVMVLFAVHAHMVYAQDFVPLAPIETGSANPQENFLKCTSGEVEGVWNKEAGRWTTPPSCLPKYLRTLYNTGVALAGLFLVFSIVRGGFTLMFTDSILGKLEGKKVILQALGGAVIVYSSYLFMNTLNPQLADDLNLSLSFPRVTVKAIPVELQPVTAEDLRAKLRNQLDTVNPQIRLLTEQRDAKLKLATDKTAAANKPGVSPELKAELEAEAVALRGEAAALDTQQKLLGDINAPSERITKAHADALAVLWDPASLGDEYKILGIPIKTVSKTQQITEANRLVGVMELERNKILALPDGTDKTNLLKELNDAKKALQDQIRYFKNGCDRATGTKGERYFNPLLGIYSVRQIPCPP